LLGHFIQPEWSGTSKGTESYETSQQVRPQYGLIAGLIAVVIIVAVTTVGTGLKSKFESIGTTLTAP
jgi:hypothetical protein